jgi:hypothetical protein
VFFLNIETTDSATHVSQFALPVPRGGRNDKGDIVLSESELLKKTRKIPRVRYFCAIAR